MTETPVPENFEYFLENTALCLKKVPTFKLSVTLSNLNRFLPERHYVTFGSLLSQFRLSSVCLSSVCNVGAPYSGG